VGWRKRAGAAIFLPRLLELHAGAHQTSGFFAAPFTASSTNFRHLSLGVWLFATTNGARSA
jgi:hypothetical protein